MHGWLFGLVAMLSLTTVAAQSIRVEDPVGDAANVPFALAGRPSPVATDGDLVGLVLRVEDGRFIVQVEAVGPRGVETSPGHTLAYTVSFSAQGPEARGGGLLTATRDERLAWTFAGTYGDRPIPVTGQADMGGHRVTIETMAEEAGIGPGSTVHGHVAAVAWVGVPGTNGGGFGDLDLLDGSERPLTLPGGEWEDIMPEEVSAPARFGTGTSLAWVVVGAVVAGLAVLVARRR